MRIIIIIIILAFVVVVRRLVVLLVVERRFVSDVLLVELPTEIALHRPRPRATDATDASPRRFTRDAFARPRLAARPWARSLEGVASARVA